MLSDQSTVGDSNRTEADGAGRFGNRSAPAASCSHFSHIYSFSIEENFCSYTVTTVHVGHDKNNIAILYFG